jgi:hypothetical protein
MMGWEMLANREDAYKLLTELGAPNRLLTHLRLVGEVADELIKLYRELNIKPNSSNLGSQCTTPGRSSTRANLRVQVRFTRWRAGKCC